MRQGINTVARDALIDASRLVRIRRPAVDRRPDTARERLRIRRRTEHYGVVGPSHRRTGRRLRGDLDARRTVPRILVLATELTGVCGGTGNVGRRAVRIRRSPLSAAPSDHHCIVLAAIKVELMVGERRACQCEESESTYAREEQVRVIALDGV